MYYCGELPILMVGIMTLYRNIISSFGHVACLLFNTVWQEPFEGEKFRRLVENGILRGKNSWIACLSLQTITENTFTDRH